MCCSYAVPPTRSGFLDFGPDPDFFDQTDPDVVWNLVKKSVFFSSKICQNNAWNWLLLAPFERVSRRQLHIHSPGVSGFFYLVWILEENGWDLVWNVEKIGTNLVRIFILFVWNLNWRHWLCLKVEQPYFVGHWLKNLVFSKFVNWGFLNN